MPTSLNAIIRPLALATKIPPCPTNVNAASALGRKQRGEIVEISPGLNAGLRGSAHGRLDHRRSAERSVPGRRCRRVAALLSGVEHARVV